MTSARTISLRGGLHARLARPTDTDAAAVIAYFDRVTLETDFAPFGPGEYPRNLEQEALHLRNYLDPSKGLALHAVIGTELAGIVTISRQRPPRIHHCGLLGISVVQKYWGVGLGRALCEAAILEARHIGLLRIELHTRQDNHRAIALYEALGFEHEGRLRGAFRVGTVEYDDLVMGLRLHAGPGPVCPSG
jgi:RimJ/RimL family protein N-acetyltransferase